MSESIMTDLAIVLNKDLIIIALVDALTARYGGLN